MTATYLTRLRDEMEAWPWLHLRLIVLPWHWCFRWYRDDITFAFTLQVGPLEIDYAHNRPAFSLPPIAVDDRLACEVDASCAPGDHTLSWPCDFAPGTGPLYDLAQCDVWCDLEGCNSPHRPPGHAEARAAAYTTPSGSGGRDG